VLLSATINGRSGNHSVADDPRKLSDSFVAIWSMVALQQARTRCPESRRASCAMPDPARGSGGLKRSVRTDFLAVVLFGTRWRCVPARPPADRRSPTAPRWTSGSGSVAAQPHASVRLRAGARRAPRLPPNCRWKGSQALLRRREGKPNCSNAAESRPCGEVRRQKARSARKRGWMR